jgi:hypothetical protein
MSKVCMENMLILITLVELYFTQKVSKLKLITLILSYLVYGLLQVEPLC